MSIRIRQQCWDRAAEDNGSDLTAERAAEALRAQGHEVEVINGDWGHSYYADEDSEHLAVQSLAEDRPDQCSRTKNRLHSPTHRVHTTDTAPQRSLGLQRRLNMIAAPVLSSDRQDLPARCYLERAIVANLIAHLQAAGFEPTGVNDGGDERITTRDLKSAMEAIFAVDDSKLYVRKAGAAKNHTIVITLGNGQDCITDRSVGTGFDEAMESFDRDVLPCIVSGEALHKALAEKAAECASLNEQLDAVTHNETELKAALRKVAATLEDCGDGDAPDWQEALRIANDAIAP